MSATILSSEDLVPLDQQLTHLAELTATLCDAPLDLTATDLLDCNKL